MSAPTLRLLAATLAVVSAAPALAQLEPEVTGAPTAIQERAYRMMHEIDLTVGALPLDPYTKGFSVGGGYVVHFSDGFAWEIARGGYNFGVKSDLRGQLERDFGILPNAFESPQFFAGTDIQLKPFYGKLSVVNRWVVHAEIFFTVGASFFKYQAATDFRLGPSLGVHGRIFLNKVLSLRLGLDDHVIFTLVNARQGNVVTNVMSISLSLGINLGATE